MWCRIEAMAGFFVLLFPPLLLVFMLFMGKVEEPLDQVNTEREIEKFLDDASPEELDTFVREGTDSALRRFRQRLSLHRLLPTSSRRRPHG
jgi:Na+-transporting methylmalonyl-CoA/oxaloacetate decarboxylase gamma subunit